MTQKYIMKHRRGTFDEWQQSGIIPYAGEIVVEIDNEHSLHKLKIGDGVHTYSELAYLKAGDEIVNQVLSQALPHIISVTLDVNAWQEVTDATNPNVGYYSQVIEIEGVNNCCRLDLQPDVNALAEFKKLGIIFTTENNGGVITVYSIGVAPSKTYTMQATLVETELSSESEKILGLPVGSSAETSVPTKTSDLINDSGFITDEYHDSTKQNTLVSGTNIKTVNGNSLLGSGNIEISGGVTSVNGQTGDVTITVPTKTSDLENDEGFITSSDIPEGAAASTTVPKAAGTAAVGTELAFARGDHVHPAQTDISGNAGTATQLADAKTITLSGDVSGSVSFDGSADVTITTTVADDSHNHVISNVDGLQTALDGKAASDHTHSGYVNQNAFSNVVVGSTTIAADSATDTLTLVAGTNIELVPDAANDKVTINNKYTYTLPNATSSTLGGVKVGNNITVSGGTISLSSSNVTNALGYTPANSNSIGNGTITIKQGGTTKGTFTTNQSGNTTIILDEATSGGGDTNGFYRYNGVISESPVVEEIYYDVYSDSNTIYPSKDADGNTYGRTNGQMIVDDNGVMYYVFEDDSCVCAYVPPVNKDAESGGADTSLVTTGEKYTWNNKQDTLVSGATIKTINGTSLLGSGNIEIGGGSASEIPVLDLGDVSSIGSSVSLTSDQITWINNNYNKISAIKFSDNTDAGGTMPLLLSTGNYQERTFYYSGIYFNTIYYALLDMDNYSGTATSGTYYIQKTNIGSVSGGGSGSEPTEQETMFSGEYNNWYNGDSSPASLYLDTSSAGLTHSKIESFEFTFSLHNTYTSETEITVFQISVDDLYRMYQSGNHGMSILGGRFLLGLATDFSLNYDKGTFNYAVTVELTPNWSDLYGYDYAGVSTGFTYRGFKFANGNTY